MTQNGDVLVEYGVIRNGNKRAGGWLPRIWTNGRGVGHTWATRSHDRDDALRLAEADARDIATRYIGDWRITVREHKQARWP
jgi:hypothetical protein